MDAGDITRLNENESYGKISGPRPDGARFEQEGRLYDGMKNLIRPKGEAKPAEAEKVETSTTTVEDDVPLEKVHWMTLKKMVKEAGGTYENKKQAIEFLRNI